MTDLTIRRLVEADLPAAAELGRLAFGSATGQPPLTMSERYLRWGAFDDNGRLVAKATDLPQQTWWGGRLLPTCGIGGVAVEPEWRGSGVARRLLLRLLEAATEGGAVLAQLFCTSTAVYRSIGFEVGGIMRDVQLSTTSLPHADRDTSITLQALPASDWAAVSQVFEAVASEGNGVQLRREHANPAEIDGVTAAVDATGEPVGYLTWERGRGYGDDSVVTAADVFATTPAAARALLANLRSWETVAPTVRLRLLPWTDAVAALLPTERLREHEPMPWMQRPLDIAGAVAGRGWSAGVSASVRVAIDDPSIQANSGPWELAVDGGRGSLTRAAGTDQDDMPALDVRGWTMLWCGVARTASLRHAGLLRGGSAAEDWALDLMLGSSGPAAQLDYF